MYARLQRDNIEPSINIDERNLPVKSEFMTFSATSRQQTVKLSPENSAVQPKCRMMLSMASMSFKCGQFSIVTGSSVRIHAAIMGNAAFFAVWIDISPCNGLPPSIISFCIHLSSYFDSI